MSQPLTFTILGCGNSTGVPGVGGYWGQCDPLEPKNTRTRPSLHVRSLKTSLIIDAGADFRAQTIREAIERVDGILLTHAHGDHVHGLDDIRGFVHRHPELKQMPVYTNAATFAELERRFYYLFQGGDNRDLYPPLIQKHTVEEGDYHALQTLGDITFTPLPMEHGNVTSVGYRFGALAYCTDVKTLSPQALETLKGVKHLIIDSAGYHHSENPVHASLKEIEQMNETISAQTIYLTSLSLAMDYQTLLAELPSHMIPCYDGLKITL